MGRHITVTTYGLTETSALGTHNNAENYLKKPASVGGPMPPLVEARIVDPSGQDLPTGTQGEICLKSASNFCCYWKNEEATTRAMLEGGWFRTGDMGYMDEDSDVFITDRIKEIVIRGGENISSREVEFAIYEHPEVIEAAVFGIPDPALGEKLVAMVGTKPDYHLTEEDLRKFLSSRLAGFKIPEEIRIQTDPLPRLGSGKLSKLQLKQTYQERLKRAEVIAP